MIDATTTRNIASRTAASYIKRCWWVDPDDVRQIVALTILSAARTYSPEHGQWSHYLQRALRLRLGDELLAQSSPVSARSGHRTPLVGHTRAEVSPTLPAHCATPETTLAIAELRALLYREASAIGVQPHVVALLLDETSYAAERERLGVTTELLVKATQRALKLLRSSHLLAELREHYK